MPGSTDFYSRSRFLAWGALPFPTAWWENGAMWLAFRLIVAALWRKAPKPNLPCGTSCIRYKRR